MVEACVAASNVSHFDLAISLRGGEEVKCGPNEDWDPLLQALEGPTREVTSVAVLEQNRLVAFATHLRQGQVVDSRLRRHICIGFLLTIGPLIPTLSSVDAFGFTADRVNARVVYVAGATYSMT